MATDIIEATGAEPFKEVVAGAERVFLDLTVYDRAAIQVADRKARKAQLAENLKLSGLPPEDVFQTLQGFDKARPVESDWFAIVDDPTLAGPILAASLERTYPGEGEAIAKQIAWPQPKAFATRVKLAGLVIQAAPAAKSAQDTRTFGDGEGESPDPTATPATFGDAPAKT